MATPTSSPARNDPCPCGSGLKYKRCCGRLEGATAATTGEPQEPVSAKPAAGGSGLLAKVLMGGVGLIVVLFIAAMILGSREVEPAPVVIQTGNGTPEPWYYDAVLNRHWDPGHAHWHSGPPPPLESRETGAAAGATPATAPAETPAPWYYDAVNDQHWDPGHAHWHPGPPPPEDER